MQSHRWFLPSGFSRLRVSCSRLLREYRTLIHFHLRSEAEETFADEAIAFLDGEILSSGMPAGTRDNIRHDTRNDRLGLTLRIDGRQDSGTIVDALHFEDVSMIAREQVRV